jgi:Tol biopolymer transport system component
MITLAMAAFASGWSPAGLAGPAKTALVDCACYDILRVASGHAPTTVFKNSGQNLFDVSRNRRRMVYSGSLGRLYVSRIDGSKARLIDRRSTHWAVFSPDGKRVAYGADGCGVCIARVDGRGRRRLAVAGARGPVAWSPDSKRLAFVISRSPRATKGVLAVARPNGRGLRRLVKGRAFDGGTTLGVKMAWSPRGGRLAYLTGSPTRLHVLRLRDRRQLAVVHGRAPIWSPNGRRLAYSNGFRVASMRFDGTGRHELDPYSVDPYGVAVSWSPSGRRVAFARYPREERYQLTTATFKGRRPRVLVTEGHDVEIGPTYWAPNGRAILYTTYQQVASSS